MKVVIDLLETIPGKSGAVGFWRNMLKLMPGIDSSIEYYVFVTNQLRKFYEGVVEVNERPNLHLIDVPYQEDSVRKRLYFKNIGIPRYIKEQHVDIHFSCYPSPILFPSRAKEVWKVTALQHFFFPKQVKLKRAIYHRVMDRLKSRRSAKIIANSNWTKRGLMEKINIPEEKIEVIYEAVDHDIFNMNLSFDFCQQEIEIHFGNIQLPYILYVSELRPYKNQDKLIKAFGMLVNEKRIPHKLILIGNDWMGYRNTLRKLAKDLIIEERVIFVDSLHQEKLVSFYRCADLFIYPSSLETFGIPPLESMACGTAVIASNQTAVPEIVGDGGLIVDPENKNELSKAILEVLSKKSLKSDLIQKGFERTKKFNYHNNAKATSDIFRLIGA